MATRSIPVRPATPWNSIAEGMVDNDRGPLRYEQALESPCLSCKTAPCCSYLPLHTFTMESVVEVDQAVYLLNFDHIELGVTSGGEWSVYYRYPCRFLDRATFACTVHDTPTQPDICVHYNPYDCWYKRALTKRSSDEYIRIDRPRLEYLIDKLTFDETGRITDFPIWLGLVSGIAALPLEPAPAAPDPPGPDAATQLWHEIALSPGPVAEPATATYGYDDLRQPCDGCSAPCCTTLVFPHDTPTTRSSLDFLRFCLGFPGIEVGIGDDGWQLVVRTTCRHLEGNRCSVFGRPERPLVCKYYDASKCTYKVNFGQPRPPAYVRVTLEQFHSMTDCFRFDEHGEIVGEVPGADVIRSRIEERWREAELPQR